MITAFWFLGFWVKKKKLNVGSLSSFRRRRTEV